MTFALVLATAFAVSAALPARASAGIGTPAIWSENPDYGPGDTVTLRGDGWGIGEVVHINVNDDAGQTWSRDVDVTADLFGNVTDEFTLPDWFVAVYTVTATAPSGTATASFTDGNVKARTNASGFTFRLDWTRHNGTNPQPQPDCNAPESRQTTGFNPAVGFSGGGAGGQFSDGVPSDSSIVLEAADVASNGFVFIGWSGETSSDAFLTRTDPHEICVPGDFTGTRMYVANYEANVPPAVAADNASRTVNEGQTATNTGTFSDANALDTVTLSASVGSITQSGMHSGTWSWSFGTTDGPNQSQTVTITATDNHGATSTTTFALTVDNVAPSIAISGAGSVNEGSLYSLTLGAVSDPGTDTVSSYVVHWGDGNSDTYPSNGVKTHTYADGPATRAVTVDLIDEDGTFLNRANAHSVTVNNVAPTVTLTGDQSVVEGSTHTYSYTTSDPGSEVFVRDAQSCDGGTLSAATFTPADGSGSFDCTYADGLSSHNPSVTVSDGDGGSDSDSLAVTVNNVAPSIAISGAASVNEGSSYSLTLGAVSDPGADTVSSYVVHWGDGASNTYSSNGDQSHTYADGPNDYDVTVDLVDEDGTFLDAANDHSVHVNNVAPSITISGAANVNEGSSYSLTLGAVSDPGADTVSSYVVHWGDGASNTYSSNGDQSHTYADGPNDYDVTVDLVDEDGIFLDAANDHSVHVNNVAPTVTLSNLNDVSVNESGSTEHTYSYSISDPGVDDVSSVSTSCGANGAKVALSDANTNSSGSFRCTFPDGSATTSSTVSASATDEDGDTGNTDTQSVSVANVAPTAHLSGPGNVDEGSTHTYTFAVTDPGVDTFTVNTPAYPDCGTGGNYVGGSLSTNPGGGSFDCSFPDGPTTTDVKIRVTDSDGASDTDTENVVVVAVANLNPVVTLTGPSPVAEGSTHTYSYTTSDEGTETFARDAQSCDGGTLSAATFTPADGSGSFDCTYADGLSSHNPSVTVSDGDGGSDSDSLAVTVNNVAPSIAISGAANVNEGSSYSLTLGAVSDPGTDTVSDYVVHWGDGSSDSYASNGVKLHTYADGVNNYDVTVDLVDEDGTFLDRANALSVHVNNVAPSIAISGAASVNEGSAYSLTLGAVSDPGVDTVSSWIVHWGDGNSNTYSTDGIKSHTYADGVNNYDVTVDLVDEDGTFLDAANDHPVHVNNVAPSIAISGAASVNEGSAYSLTLGAVSDPGVDTVSSWIVHWGDGNSNTYSTDGIKSHTYADGVNNYDVTVDLVDEDGTFLDAANDHPVHVNNVAPTVNFTSAPDTAYEGDTKTYVYTVTDPGVDTFTVDATYPKCGLHGTLVGTPTVSASGGSFQCNFPDGPNSSTVAIKVTDSDGDSDTDSEAVQIVAIANVAPSVTAPADQSSNEGASHSFSLGSFTDPGSDADWTVSVDWGDGSFDTVFTTGSTGTIAAQSHTYVDGPNDYIVSVTVTDKDGASGDKSFSVHVNNVAPSVPNLVSPADNATTSDATPTFDWSDSTDPAGANDTITYTIQVDNNGCSFASPEINQSGLSSSGFTPAADLADGTYCWRVRATDSDGDNSAFSATRTVTIDTNDPPVANAGADVSGNEGSAIALNGSGSDPDGDAITFKWTYAPVSGVDAGATCSFAPNDTAEDPTITCTDDGTYKATLTVKDSKGAETSDDATVTVSNANPVVTAVNETPPPYAMGSTVVVSANFTDAGTNDTHRTPPGGNCTVSWDDGTPSSTGVVAESNGSGSCTASHVYSGAGVYTVTITVTDDDGGSGSATAQVVVYDPSAGFITGGGWINVAPGSYPAGPTLSGRANFGFTSKYKKGASIPTGETEFNFQVAGFRFHSSNYQWLVVSGYKAQYKGTGEVNGAPGYDFRLTAYDGAIGGSGNTGQDRFRIKITEHATGAVVFDNRLGSSDDMDFANPQAINGGSIVIHKA